ncbi:SPFH domain-containing protein [Chitinophaga lutea]|uniref:SPFH domain-containing protein n=1 Tax=Chitinophaga lutea TaxID=2488634 RepID=A0A3N4Q0I0_9BACT|nr:SPFH domain-containing protein [Chitinophaga lutea]RPE09460.1 SPFH domain-containing protein [Chitinophaga lutea]
MEKIIQPMSGYLAFVLCILTALAAGYAFFAGWEVAGVILIVLFIFITKGIMIVNPNHARVLTFFGKYVGSVKQNGLLWINPLYGSHRISLRANNLNGQTLKVNDKMGNPIEIAAVIVWQVSDTYKAVFEVEGYQQYVQIQSEAAVRHLATSCPYDRMEDENADITLRDGGEKVNDMLEQELNARLAAAGITVKEARISHLAYAPEIAGAMLQRQQATAIVAARSKIVEGAVGMVEMALEQLSRKQIVTLDEERKAAMVSNLMVVLCGEKAATPVLNTGSLYQ